MGSENRKRNNMIPIRLSDEEHTQLQLRSEIVGVTIPAYLRCLAIHAEAPTISKVEWKAIRDELRRIRRTLDVMSDDYTFNSEPVPPEIEVMSKSLEEIKIMVTALAEKSGGKKT
ncbi:hypothetical protein MKX41_02200 [Paenibacillus sp. FSL R5-0475]|uniref:plasmid mobilization protein n=1 Tax=Paenibacillus sp. FSL R5-0475 TaxID=2921643 RepID=UPI0030F7F08D